ncbi:phage head morphogenesis protein [Acinetobacter baumannii]|nr:minor capsid protein [Acinetobacter baumannii]MDC4710447.1 minor capsid protein [Acinetobacter baumannii]MDC4808316.1 minor capsid protein [Acinetobacter baumannii]MDC4811646.1 minor capsid protein [Acinetobacter baumannii]HCV3155069.1 minor capsid protein [Acinetobacter baumannii]
MTTIIQIMKPHLQQAKKRKKGRKASKPRAVHVNRRVELYYARQLLAISKYCQEQTKELVIPTVGQNIGDAWFSDMMTAFREKLTKYVVEVSRPLATKVVTDTQKEVDKQIAEHTKTIIGVDLTPFFRAADIQDEVDLNITANVSLIKSIPQQYADKLEVLITNALQTGQTNEELAKAIKQLGLSTDYRARLIASDQMGKINGQINQARQLSMGVETYTWQTAKDERVRPDHQHKQGKTFRWDSPPDGGHPGQPIRCRCTALPNYEDILID